MPMRKSLAPIILLVLWMAGAVSAHALDARIVRLSLVEGDVQVDRNIGQGVERAILNMPITSGVRLETFQDGRAEVEFENGSTMRMAGPASVTFRELSMNDNGDKHTLIQVDSGTVYFDVHHKGDDNFQVAVQGQTVTLEKTAQIRVEADEQQAKVAVYKGEAKVSGYGEHATVKKNETLALDSEDPGRYYLAKGIDENSYDEWDRSRENYRDQYADASGYQYANSAYGAPYSYGMADMLSYGSYFNAPGYGWLWRPSAFDIGWDPFSNGAWSYYPGYGYVYVSTYPWGWTPYRYGSWMYVPAYGWCWSPARSYRTWNVIPVVVHPPRGFLPLHRPRPTPGPILFVDSHHRPVPRPPQPPIIIKRTPRDRTGVVVPGQRNPRMNDADDPFSHRTGDRGRPLPGNSVRGSQPATVKPTPRQIDGIDRRDRPPEQQGPARDVVVRPAPTPVPERRVDPAPRVMPRVEPNRVEPSPRREAPTVSPQPVPRVQRDAPAAPPVRQVAPPSRSPAPVPRSDFRQERIESPRGGGFSGGRMSSPAMHSGGGGRRGR